MIRTNLHLLMAKKRLKISDVSNETGISRTTLTAIYYGRCKALQIATIEKLCQFFNCSIGELFEYTEEKGV